MSKPRRLILSFSAILLLSIFPLQSAFASTGTMVKYGMRGDTVTGLQKDLKSLGYISISPTGYFGSITKSAVISFQKKNGLSPDGIAGTKTFAKINGLLGVKTTTTVSRGDTERPGQSIVDYAKKFLGVGYVWGGSSPEGFDCSGFTSYVYKHFGITLNRVSSNQAKQGTGVSKGSLLPGDLVFFDTNGGMDGINHAGIYAGDGKFIHASSGNSCVMISSLVEGFYSGCYMTARRIV